MAFKKYVKGDVLDAKRCKKEIAIDDCSHGSRGGLALDIGVISTTL